MKPTGKVSVTRIGDATYRVSRANGRSALTGRFVSDATAQRPIRPPVTRERGTDER